MRSHYGGQFDDELRRYKKFAPVKQRVVVRTVPASWLKRYHGEPVDGHCDVDYEANVTTLRIAKGLSMVRACDALEHEYAHSWREQDGQPKDRHDKKWGEAFSIIHKIRTGFAND